MRTKSDVEVRTFSANTELSGAIILDRRSHAKTLYQITSVEVRLHRARLQLDPISHSRILVEFLLTVDALVVAIEDMSNLGMLGYLQDTIALALFQLSELLCKVQPCVPGSARLGCWLIFYRSSIHMYLPPHHGKRATYNLT